MAFNNLDPEMCIEECKYQGQTYAALKVKTFIIKTVQVGLMVQTLG